MKRQVVHNHVKLQRLIRTDKLSKYQFALLLLPKKCTVNIGTKSFQKIKCTDIFGTRNVRIWRRTILKIKGCNAINFKTWTNQNFVKKPSILAIYSKWKLFTTVVNTIKNAK